MEVTAPSKSYRLMYDTLAADGDPRRLFARAVRRAVAGYVPHRAYAEAAAAAELARPDRLVAQELALECNPLGALFAGAGSVAGLRARWNGFNAAARLGVRTRMGADAALYRDVAERQGAGLRAELIAACVDALARRAAQPASTDPRGELERSWHDAAGGGVPAELLPLLYAQPTTQLAMAARGLGCSLRTVQRALARDGLSYELLRQAVRLTIAGHHLRQGVASVTDAAQAAGFHDAAHLNHAWRAACDITPLRYRALARLY